MNDESAQVQADALEASGRTFGFRGGADIELELVRRGWTRAGFYPAGGRTPGGQAPGAPHAWPIGHHTGHGRLLPMGGAGDPRGNACGAGHADPAGAPEWSGAGGGDAPSCIATLRHWENERVPPWVGP